MAGSPLESDAAPGEDETHPSPGERLLRAIAHPVRVEILRVLSNRVASPKEVAEEIGESIGNVSYHFKYLRKEGRVEILETEQRRGAIAHYYRAVPSPPHEEEVRDLFGEAVRALNAGTLDAAEDRRLSWVPMELDERGWSELLERQAAWLEELDRIEAEAAERLESANAPGKRVVAAAVAFQTPPGPSFATSTPPRRDRESGR